MKKLFAMLLVLVMMASAAALAEDAVKIGQVEWAAHGTKCFAVLTVAMQDDVIVDAYIDEFQVLGTADAVGVPNSDADFGGYFPEGQALASKRVNNAYYSSLLQNHAGATKTLEENYAAIEAYVTGKTVAELEAAVAGKTAEEMVDVVSSSTLADTLGYVTGLIEAAKTVK